MNYKENDNILISDAFTKAESVLSKYEYPVCAISGGF